MPQQSFFGKVDKDGSMKRAAVLLTGPKRIAIYCSLLIAVTLGVYSNHFGNSFHFDDSHTVVDNPYIRTLAHVPRFFSDPSTFSNLPTHHVYRPIVSASLAIDYWLARGLQPWAFHATTFAWYCLQLVLMFFLYRRLTGGRELLALFAVAVYGLHPVSAETVNYVIQRAEIYSTLGVTAALWIYIAKPNLRRYGLYLVPFVLAGLSKPPALVFPALLMIYIRIFESGSWRKVLRESAASLVTTVGIAILLSRMVGRGFAPGGGDRVTYWITQTWVTLEYFMAFFWPAHLSADSDEGLLQGLPAEALMGILFVILLIIAIVRLAKMPAWRPAAFGLAWFIVTLLPTALMPLGEVANDHRMFFPFVGLSLAVCWTAMKFLERWETPQLRPAVIAAACLILTTAAYGTYQRNEAWRTEETLWHDVTIKSPRNGRGWMNYGLTLMARADYTGALACFDRALIYTPNYPVLEINLGIVKGMLRRDVESEKHFQRALALQPSSAAAHTFYGRWLLDRQRYSEAALRLESALRIAPRDTTALHLLMKVHFDQQNWSALRPLTTLAIETDPFDAVAKQYQTDVASLESQAESAEKTSRQAATPESYLNLSLIYYRAGQFDKSLSAARQALTLRPGYTDALNNIAAANNAMHRWDDGMAAAEQAIRLDPSNQLARNNLAWARAEKGKSSR